MLLRSEHITTLNRATESKQHIRLKKPETKEHIWYDPIYRKFKNKPKNYKYMLGYITDDKTKMKSHSD